MTEALIAGVGIHPFGSFEDKPAEDIGLEAVSQALADAGIEYKHVEAAYCASMYAPATSGPRILNNLGMTGIPVADVEAACASGAVAIRQAFMSIVSGLYDCVLAFGIEKMPKGFMDPSQIYEPWQVDMGLSQNPMYWALMARRYMEDYGLTPLHLAKVSVKNHRFGAENPNAMYRKPFSVEEVLTSKMVCDPLTLYMVASPSQGAAAAVVCSPRFAKKNGVREPVRIAASEHRTSMHPWFRAPAFSWSTREDNPAVTEVAAGNAYERAGLGPKDLDVAEMQDTDSLSEIMFSEQIGLAPAGEGLRLIDEGATDAGGSTPVNTSGGILSCGEPVGASHLRQIHEITSQLRGRAGSRQVPDAKVGLAHVLGAGGNSAVTILTR